MIEYFLTGIVIPIFIGVAIDKISNKKEKNKQSIGRNGGFTFSITIKFRKKKLIKIIFKSIVSVILIFLYYNILYYYKKYKYLNIIIVFLFSKIC